MTGTEVRFTWRGPRGARCELFGDVSGWTDPVHMPEVAPGFYMCALRLPPGVYRYKFRLNSGQWLADPTAITDPTEGYDNSVVIVGGTEPPLFFAPDRRHVIVYEDGRVVVHFEYDGGEPRPFSVDGVALDTERVAARHGRYSVTGRGTIAAGTGLAPQLQIGAYRAPLPAPRSPLGQPPAWARRAVFYAIFVDRWHRGAVSAPDKRASPREAPSTAHTFYGGDLWGVAEGIDYLSELGVDAIVLTPIQTSPSPHRYDGTDLFTIDPRLGGEPALASLIDAAHRRGLRIVADASLTHVHEEHPAFQSVLSAQEASRHRGWFHIRRFPVRARDPSCVDLYPTKPHLPWLNLGPGAAREHVIEAAARLVRHGIDGLRLDAMSRAPDDFWRELRRRVRAENPEALLLGEIVTDRPARFAEERGVDLATAFGHREAMLDFFRRQSSSAPQLIERLAFHDFRAGPFAPSFRLLFLDNHDTDRFLLQDTHFNLLRLALTYLLLRPEPVWLTYGTEMALRGEGVVARDEAWRERMPMPPLVNDANKTQRLVRALLALRHREPACQSDALRWIYSEGRVLIFDRGEGDQTLRVALNAGREPWNLASLWPTNAEILLVIDDGFAEGGATLAPLSAVVARLRRS